MTITTAAVDALRDNITELWGRVESKGAARDRATLAKLQATLGAITPADLDLASFDVWAVNSSAGKDSQAMLDVMVEFADAIGFDRDRIVVIHADLGRAEWAGTRELAAEQAAHYGVGFVVTKARTKDGTERDLVDQIRARGMFPDNANRYCTSDQKRGPCRRAMTDLARELDGYGSRPIRILNLLGIRGEESAARAKVSPIVPAFIDGKPQAGSSGRKHVTTLFPIYDWTEDQVWARIKSSGVRYHPAYDLGMPRLSCVFCVFAPRSALIIAGRHNRELLAEYVAVERDIGHTFRKDLPIADIADAVDSDELVRIGGAWDM